MKNIKAFLLSVILLSALSGAAAQAPDWLWAKSAGGINDDEGTSIATDNSGNTYVTGSFQGTATFGTINLTSSGGFDIFAAKLNSAGNWIWAIKAGGTDDDRGAGIAVDSAGNVYLTGYYGGYSGQSATFGTITLTNSGYHDIFVAKLNSGGNWLWAQRAGGSNNELAYSIAVDSAANVYLSGEFGGSATFGANSLTSSGNADIFVAKLNNSGDWLWAQSAGGSDNDAAYSIAVDSTAKVYLTGDYRGTATFGATELVSLGNWEIFVAKLDGSGNWLWAQSAGGISTDHAFSIAVDSAANVYLTGNFYQSASFGTITLTSSGAYNIFVAKLGSAGNWLWAKNAGGTSYDYGRGIALDGAGNIYITGNIAHNGSASFGGSTIISSGGDDIFVAKMDTAGNWLWAKRAGGSDNDIAYGIAVDSAANIYLTGGFSSTAGFGSGSLTSSGDEEIFVAKLAASVDADDDLNPPVIASSLSASPNPFKQATTLSISLDKAGGSQQDLSLALYDLKGRRVRTMALGPARGNELSLSWDGRDENGAPCPNGIYFVRLYAGERQLSSAKVTLIR